MSNVQYVQLQPQHKPWQMLKALLGIGAICAFLLVFVYQATAPIISKNHQILLQNSISKLFPDTHHYKAYRMEPAGLSRITRQEEQQADLYRIYDQQDQTMGYAIKAAGMGYQDSIKILYSYLPQQQIISGYVILSSRETPGLGTKIETDSTFLAQFQALPVPLDSSLTQLANDISSVKKGKKTQSWQVDTITGATISSRSFIQILSRSSSSWIPKLFALPEVKSNGQ